MSSFRYKATLLLAALVVCTAAGGAFAAEDLLKKVKSAIQQAEKDGIPPKDQACKLPYDDAHMSAILLAIGDYFSKPASRALNARLQFKPDYRDGGNQTQIIRRPVRQNPNYRRLGGDYEMVEIKKTNSQAVLKGYFISGGDVDSLREIQLVCSDLNQALKDTPLDTSSARRFSPALKNLHTLLESLPKFAGKYLEVEGDWPQKYTARLAEVATKREELLRIYKDWLAEMAVVKKAASQPPAPSGE